MVSKYFYLGWASLLEAFGVIPGTVQSCAALLKKGNLLAIAPGGVYEAQLGDNAYELLWRQRTGFAKVAIESQKVCTFIYNFIIHFFKWFLLFSLSLSFQYSQETFERLFVLSTHLGHFGAGSTTRLSFHWYQFTEVSQSN